MRGWKTVYGSGFSVEVPNDFVALPRADGHMLIHDAAESIEMELEMIVGDNQAEGSDRPGGQFTADDVPIKPRQALLQFTQWLEPFHEIRLTESPRQLLGMHHVTCTAQGVDRLGVFPGLLQKVMRKNSVRGSRFWAVFHGHAVVYATCRGTCKAVNFLKPIEDGIIAGVRLGVAAALKRPFIQAVVDLARDITPATQVAPVDDDTISVGGMRIRVSPLHETYLEHPENLAENMKRFFDELFVRETDQEEDNADGPWMKVRAEVFPVLVPKTVAATLPANVITEEWVNDLIICYQVKSRSTLVSMEDCRLWGVDQETLHEYSMGNLLRTTRELNMTGGKCDNYTLFSFPTDHPLNGARILLPLVQHHLRPYLGSNFYMATPDRDLLLAFSCEDERTLKWIRHQVELRYSKSINPLSDKLFLVTPDGVVGDRYRLEEEDHGKQ